MENGHLTRRSLLRAAALAGTALSAFFARGAFAAGKLACGFWDHWVPGANDTLTKLCKEWGGKEKVDEETGHVCGFLDPFCTAPFLSTSKAPNQQVVAEEPAKFGRFTGA